MLSISLTMAAPIDRHSFVTLANSSSILDEDEVAVRMGVDGGASSIDDERDERLAMLFPLAVHSESSGRQ